MGGERVFISATAGCGALLRPRRQALPGLVSRRQAARRRSRIVPWHSALPQQLFVCLHRSSTAVARESAHDKKDLGAQRPGPPPTRRPGDRKGHPEQASHPALPPVPIVPATYGVTQKRAVPVGWRCSTRRTGHTTHPPTAPSRRLTGHPPHPPKRVAAVQPIPTSFLISNSHGAT